MDIAIKYEPNHPVLHFERTSSAINGNTARSYSVKIGFGLCKSAANSFQFVALR